VNQDNGRIGQRLDQAGFGKTGIDVVSGHDGQLQASVSANCKDMRRPIESFDSGSLQAFGLSCDRPADGEERLGRGAPRYPLRGARPITVNSPARQSRRSMRSIRARLVMN